MLKYCFILDEEKGLVQLGAGCSDEYYIEIGMKQRDVDQSDIDFDWYLSEKCPKKSEEQKFNEAKTAKFNENTTKAQQAIQDGYVVFKEAQFETNTQTANDLGNKRDLCILRGDTSALWLSKDDKVVELTVSTENPAENDDFVKIGFLVEDYKEVVWNVKYMGYKQQIEEATTIEEVDAIEINYNVPEVLENMEE